MTSPPSRGFARPPTLKPMTALDKLCQNSDVVAAVDYSRQACNDLRWHEALRRRKAEVRAESLVHSTAAGAATDGARLPLEAVRELSLGLLEPSDAAGRHVQALQRGYAEAMRLAEAGNRSLTQAPPQTLARLHQVIAAGVGSADSLGRPRGAQHVPADRTVPLPVTVNDPAELQARRRQLQDLMTLPEEIPALVVAALVWAELLTVELFSSHNAGLGRCMFRALLMSRGLDLFGLCVPEVQVLQDPVTFAGQIAAYAQEPEAAAADWVAYCGALVVAGCERGNYVADAIRAGRFPATK